MSDAKRRILIVDDEDFVRSALRRALRSEPYEVEEAAAPAAALELLAARKFDLILADHLMPGMTGLELLGMVRDRFPDTVRIILTGHADMQTAIDAINHGEIYRFLTKPWDDVELKITLYNAFERLDLERENRRLLAAVRSQADFLSKLERLHPGIRHVERDGAGAIVISDAELATYLGSAA